MKDKNKTDGHTKLLIDLLEGMFEELYPDDPEVINNLGGWDKILTKINKNIPTTPTPTNKK